MLWLMRCAFVVFHRVCLTIPILHKHNLTSMAAVHSLRLQSKPKASVFQQLEGESLLEHQVVIDLLVGSGDLVCRQAASDIYIVLR